MRTAVALHFLPNSVELMDDRDHLLDEHRYTNTSDDWPDQAATPS